MKNHQLQIRVSGEEKRRIRQSAKDRGMDLSSYILSMILPQTRQQFLDLFSDLLNSEESNEHLVFAQIHDFLMQRKASDFSEALTDLNFSKVDARRANYLAAMIEMRASQLRIHPPAIKGILPLEEPYFASKLQALRLHLLKNSPPPFKKRNLFIDASLGERV